MSTISNKHSLSKEGRPENCGHLHLSRNLTCLSVSCCYDWPLEGPSTALYPTTFNPLVISLWVRETLRHKPLIPLLFIPRSVVKMSHPHPIVYVEYGLFFHCPASLDPSTSLSRMDQGQETFTTQLNVCICICDLEVFRMSHTLGYTNSHCSAPLAPPSSPLWTPNKQT